MQQALFGRLERIGPVWWRAVIVVVSLVLFGIAVSDVAYALTTPGVMPHRQAVRKAYALIGFALLGFAFERARFSRLSPAGIAIAVGIYSYAIELGQIVLDGSRETVWQHGFDVASGVAGGAAGVMISQAMFGHGAPSSRAIVLLGIALALLAAVYAPVYR